MNDQFPARRPASLRLLIDGAQRDDLLFLERPTSLLARRARRRSYRRLDDLRLTEARALVERERLDPLARFAHMFDGPHDGLLILRGWTAILERACEEIDRMIAIKKLRFHWVSLQEVDGVGRFIYGVNDRVRLLVDIQGESRRAFTYVNSELPIAIQRRIDAIVWEAERLTAHSCVVCGAHCQPGTYFGRELPLCSLHTPELINEVPDEGLEGVWRCAIVRDVCAGKTWT